MSDHFVSKVTLCFHHPSSVKDYFPSSFAAFPSDMWNEILNSELSTIFRDIFIILSQTKEYDLKSHYQSFGGACVCVDLHVPADVPVG